jgi:hypothetical protein
VSNPVQRKLAPERYVEWINQHLGFNPRGQQHSNALSDYMIEDLRVWSARIDADIRSGTVIYRKNVNVWTQVIDRNLDLVLFDPVVPGPLNQARAAIEHKTLVTAHGKARKNRVGDIAAFDSHVHNHNPNAIAAATVIINISPAYLNPDKFAKDIVRTQRTLERWLKLIQGTIKLYSNLPLRERADEPNDQPEALCIVVVDYDGQNPAQLIIEKRPESPSA